MFPSLRICRYVSSIMAPALTSEASNQTDSFTNTSRSVSPNGRTDLNHPQLLPITGIEESDAFDASDDSVNVNINGHHLCINGHNNIDSNIINNNIRSSSVKTGIVRLKLSLKDPSAAIVNPENNNNCIRSQRFVSLNNSLNLTSSSSARLCKNRHLMSDHNINMSKGLSNGHDNCMLSNAFTSNSSQSTTSITSISTSSPTQSVATMGLLSGNNKDNIAQHILLLKGGKPENGQRIDLTAIQWPSLQSGSEPDLGNEQNSETINAVDNDKDRTNNNPNSSSTSSTPSNQIVNNDKLQTNHGNEQHQHTEQLTRLEINSQPSSATTENCIFNQENAIQSSEPKSQSKSMDINSHHLILQQQTERLLRRIRRLQYKQTQRHIIRQMKSFVEQQQNNSGIQCQRQVIRSEHEMMNISSPYSQTQIANAIEDRMKLLTPEGVKGLSTSALVNLVKRLESSGGILGDHRLTSSHVPPMPLSQLQHQIPSSASSPITGVTTQVHHHHLQQKSSSSHESTSTLVKLLQKNPETTSQVTLNSEEIEPLSATIGTLSANLRHFENGYDSDATNSSSGGESCDEFEEYPSDYTKQQLNVSLSAGHFIPMQKRSIWKWAVERGAIASRWTWLQAQVADLEFKIRQQNEMYRQLRATKGVISFGFNTDNTVPAAASPLTVNNTVSSITPLTNTTVSEKASSCGNVDSDSHCVRTMPLSHMRKRKLVRSMNALSGATRKAAKFSTVQCACNGLPDLISPCVLCNGRYSYVQVIDTDCMPHFERVALLDSSCHPVLSLHNDVSLGLHFSELLKRETIQKPISSRQNKKRKSPPSPTFGTKFGFDSKKSPKRSSAVISSSKLRKKYDGTTKRKYVRRAAGDSTWRKRGRPRERSSSGSSRTDSPIPSPAPSENSMSGNFISAPLNRRRRSEQHAFDINNIVIPYSIAATTRVEKLQYKEIITPKWRINEPVEESIKSCDDDPEKCDTPASGDSRDNEDISDTAFEERHEKCEVEERKRILAFLKGGTSQHGGNVRGRGARVRFDSGRTDSIGSNAGDGPQLMQNFDSNSQDSFCATPTITPPVTPCINPDTLCTAITDTPSLVTSERRRTISASNKREDSIEEEIISEVTVPPFDPRNFPISDGDFEILLSQSSHLNPCDEDLEYVGIGDPEKSNDGTITANTSRAPSPTHSEAAESAVDNIDVDNDNDNEDPEWEPKN